MNALFAVYRRCTFKNAPHLWMAICGMLAYLAVSFLAPMFQPDRGNVKFFMSQCRTVLALLYVASDLSVLLFKWRKASKIRQELESQMYAITANSEMRKHALRICNFPYKTVIHVVLAFIFFAAEDNLFQGTIGMLQFYLPHLSSTNWVGTAVGVFINMGFFFLTFVINLSSQYTAPFPHCIFVTFCACTSLSASATNAPSSSKTWTKRSMIRPPRSKKSPLKICKCSTSC